MPCHLLPPSFFLGGAFLFFLKPLMLFVCHTFHRFSFAAPAKLCAVGKVILEISGQALMCIDPLRPSFSNPAAASSLSCRPPPAAVYFPPCQLSALAHRHRCGKRRSQRNKVGSRAAGEEGERGQRWRGERGEGGERESVGQCADE